MKTKQLSLLMLSACAIMPIQAADGHNAVHWLNHPVTTAIAGFTAGVATVGAAWIYNNKQKSYDEMTHCLEQLNGIAIEYKEEIKKLDTNILDTCAQAKFPKDKYFHYLHKLEQDLATLNNIDPSVFKDQTAQKYVVEQRNNLIRELGSIRRLFNLSPTLSEKYMNDRSAMQEDERKELENDLLREKAKLTANKVEQSKRLDDLEEQLKNQQENQKKSTKSLSSIWTAIEKIARRLTALEGSQQKTSPQKDSPQNSPEESLKKEFTPTQA